MKKIVAISLVLVLSFLFVAGCGNGASQPAGDKTYTIRLGTPTGGKHQQNMTMDEFKKRIEEESDGKITVQLFPTSQLGTAAQMIEGVQGGTIEGVLIPSSYFGEL
jgi:TRAP-type C4-dicarboxylate transport system substrate-binding protein